MSGAILAGSASLYVHIAVSNGSIRARSSSMPARPYMARFNVLRRLICPSAWPLLQCSTMAFLTASRSRFNVRANCCIRRIPQLENDGNALDWKVLQPTGRANYDAMLTLLHTRGTTAPRLRPPIRTTGSLETLRRARPLRAQRLNSSSSCAIEAPSSALAMQSTQSDADPFKAGLARH